MGSWAEGDTEALRLEVPKLPATLGGGGGAPAPALVSARSGLQPGQGPGPLGAFLGQLRAGVWEDWALPGQGIGTWALW